MGDLYIQGGTMRSSVDEGAGSASPTTEDKADDDPPVIYELQLPDGTALLETQVSGHGFNLEKNKIGMLRGPSGRVFKPILKQAVGEREIAFYEQLRISSNPTDMEILRYTPAYYGTKVMRIFERRVKFLELEDITDGMSEPCVMDVKIGRRTWDPLATEQKRADEDKKYAETKRAYGFCIPGFQVYRMPSGNLQKYEKDYGKRLNSESAVEALETFLNASPNRPPCRDLVVQLLSTLWKILSLFREQRRYRMYSTSLLIAYDAKRLRHHARRQLNNSFAESLLRAPVCRSKTFAGAAARSLGSLNQIDRLAASPSPSPLGSPSRIGAGFAYPLGPVSSSHELSKPRCAAGGPESSSPTRSPRVNRTIDRLQRLKRSISLQNCESLPEKGCAEFAKESFRHGTRATPRRVPDINVHKLCRTHSYSNNFDADIIQMKEDYAALLSELSSTCEEKQNWVRVYMIDFGHVFPNQDGDLDNNYLEGIENLVKILEKFLA